MGRELKLVVTVDVIDDCDPDRLADDLMDFLAEDPENLFPAIMEVSEVEAQVAPIG